LPPAPPPPKLPPPPPNPLNPPPELPPPDDHPPPPNPPPPKPPINGPPRLLYPYPFRRLRRDAIIMMKKMSRNAINPTGIFGPLFSPSAWVRPVPLYSPRVACIIASIPPARPPAKSPVRNFGRITLLTMSQHVASGRAPSRP